MAFPFLEHDGPIPFAHRGGALEGLENTMPAFEASVALGYRYLETDLQATVDGVLLTFHDDDLSRTTGHQGKISELTYDEVKTALVGGQEPIPRLEDVLGSFPDVRLNLEPKTDAAVAPFVAVVGRTNSIDRICAASFQGRRLIRMREALGPRLCTCMGPMENARWLIASWVPLGIGMPDVPAAQVPVSKYGFPVVTQRSVDHAHEHGVQVHVWTIDDANEMDRLLDLGVDGIMTDQPTVLKEVLVRRGQWS